MAALLECFDEVVLSLGKHAREDSEVRRAYTLRDWSGRRDRAIEADCMSHNGGRRRGVAG